MVKLAVKQLLSSPVLINSGLRKRRCRSTIVNWAILKLRRPTDRLATSPCAWDYVQRDMVNGTNQWILY